MAHQRRRECNRDGSSRRGVVVGLALVTALLGCRAELRSPTSLGTDTPEVGTGGGGSGSLSGSPLTGTWAATFLITLANDIQQQTTTWTFREDGACSRSVSTYSTLEDRTLTTTSTCAWSADGSTVTVQYTGNPGTVTFAWSLAGFSSDRLVLDGVEYVRR